MTIRELLFRRTGGHWLFWISAIYFIGGFIYLYNGVDVSYLPPLYVFFLSMPFWFPPLGRSMNLDVTWDKEMLDWFKGKPAKEYLDEAKDNVYKMPPPKLVPPMPEVEPPKKEEPAKIFYRIGVTDRQRVSFSMGYSEITMNKQGCQQLIDQLTVFMNQLQDEEEDDNSAGT